MTSEDPRSQIYQHRKGGLYVVLEWSAYIEETMTTAVVYRSLRDGQVWVRPREEFEKRFKCVHRDRLQLASQ